VTVQLVGAAVLMGLGLYLHLSERHSHEHAHEAMDHEHRHVHDAHHQHAHGPDDPRSRHIPWIISGPHVRQGDLTREADLVVNTEDTCATACYLLGLPQLPYFDGKPVLAAFENPPAP